MRETHDQAVNVCEEEMHQANECEGGEFQLEKKDEAIARLKRLKTK